MEAVNEVEAAWAAGFFDGEGSVHLKRGKNLVLSLGQVDPDSFYKFYRIIGEVGNIHIRRLNDPIKQPIHLWTVQGIVAERIMELLLPYMSRTKANQFHAALEVAKQQPGWGKGRGNFKTGPRGPYIRRF